MEVHHLVLYCLLFTTAVCSRKLDAFLEYADDNQPLEATNQNCKCENGDCVTNKLGRSKCICKPGFSLQDKFTCKPCDCGPLGKCIFILTLASSESSEQYQYQKKCVCDVGKAEKDGVCVDCFCGHNSACSFVLGERRCYCIDGYSEKEGICTKCDCGFNGYCTYVNGNKKCECDEGYLELNGTCEECDCGDHGTCSFVKGEKTCNCEPGFKINNGKCEPCDCGSNSENCEFVDGVKQCKCKDRYADRYGTCEECYCGDHSQSCRFNEKQKTCSCLEGFVLKGETCERGCDKDSDCLNGGKCGKKKFCNCLFGIHGDRCEIVEDCASGRVKCFGDGAYCGFDINKGKAICKCKNDNEVYDRRIGACRYLCKKNEDCLNGGRCGYAGICSCLPGTEGEKCEIVEDCYYGRVRCRGNDAYCAYDVCTLSGTCKCKDRNKLYDSFFGRCMNRCTSCQSEKKCQGWIPMG